MLLGDKMVLNMKEISFVFLFLISLAAGCSWSGPWPRMEVVAYHLGDGVIADFLKKNQRWMGITSRNESNSNIKKDIAKIAPDVIDKNNLMEFEKEFGVKCVSKEFVTCKYHGSIDHTLSFNGKETHIRRFININFQWQPYGKVVFVEGIDSELTRKDEK